MIKIIFIQLPITWDSKHLSPKYSSIMDYGASELNDAVLGKYDIAALRYGYANEIEMKNGSIQKVNGDDIVNNLERKDINSVRTKMQADQLSVTVLTRALRLKRLLITISEGTNKATLPLT